MSKTTTAYYRVSSLMESDWTVLPDKVLADPELDGGQEIAELAALHFHEHRDGWESGWPLTFEVKADHLDGVERYDIEREARPEFTVRPAKTGGAA
ncbi:MAG: hypothetical protein ACPGYV_11665 [Phycisphaeraceae bacterium]